MQSPPAALLALLGSNVVVTHRPGLGSGAWVVRASDGRSAVVTPSTAAATEALRRAGEVSVGPVVLGATGGWVLTEHLNGPRLTPVELSRPEVLNDLAALLARWHRTPSASLGVQPARADLLGSLRTYSAAAPSLDARWRRAIAWAEQAVAQLTGPSSQLVPCHLDVGANVIATPRGLRLIDFDFAALADPAQELGQVIWEAELSEASAVRLVEAYQGAGDTSDPEIVAAAATWCVAVGISWTVWALASDSPAMSRYARRSAERLASHWARPPSLTCG